MVVEKAVAYGEVSRYGCYGLEISYCRAQRLCALNLPARRKLTRAFYELVSSLLSEMSISVVDIRVVAVVVVVAVLSLFCCSCAFIRLPTPATLTILPSTTASELPLSDATGSELRCNRSGTSLALTPRFIPDKPRVFQFSHKQPL